MTVTTTDIRTISPIGHAEAMELQAAELDRVLDLLRSFDADDWTRPTDCPDWDVRAMFLHVLGACEAGASMRENLHQMRGAMRWRKEQGGPLEAALSGLQVRERADLAPAELVERLGAVAPRTVRGRRRTPAPMRAIRMGVDGPVVEKWRLGYLIDVIYLRDLWMHRVDAARATGHDLVLTPEHDGRIVADVVAEWARRHGEPFTLELTGPAGGTFTADTATSAAAAADGAAAAAPAVPEPIVLDAVDFCRILAGRAEATGLLTTIVPF